MSLLSQFLEEKGLTSKIMSSSHFKRKLALGMLKEVIWLAPTEFQGRVSFAVGEMTSNKLLLPWFSSYPVDGLEKLDVHGVAGELSLYLDQGVAAGHCLHQEAVCGQSQRVGGALLELALSGLTHPRQVQVTLSQGPSLQMENTENDTE